MLTCSMFRQLIILTVLLLSVTALGAQSFPQSFIGHWEGELHWYKSGVDTPQRVRMQLIVQGGDTAGQYTWKIVYGTNGADSRPYLLKPVDTAKGHWVIDERNGIVLHQYWVGGRFTGAFTVGNNTILNAYSIENGKLLAEFYSNSAQPIATTGLGTEASPKVDTYATRSYQRAVLTRKM